MFAAQSLLVALGSIQFVSNLVFARLVNGEPITKVRDQNIMILFENICLHIYIFIQLFILESIISNSYNYYR